MAACNPHWRGQTHVLDGQRIDAFVRLEALQVEMALHAEIIGAKHLPKLGRILQTTGSSACSQVVGPAMVDTPSVAIAARRAAEGCFPPRTSFLTAETRAQIREIYAADFERLPYDP